MGKLDMPFGIHLFMENPHNHNTILLDLVKNDMACMFKSEIAPTDVICDCATIEKCLSYNLWVFGRLSGAHAFVNN